MMLMITLCIQMKHLLAQSMFAKKLFHLSKGWLDPLLKKKVTSWPVFQVGASNEQVFEGLRVQFGEDDERKVWMRNRIWLWPLEMAQLAWEAQAMVMKALLLSGVGGSPSASGNWPFLSEATALIAAEAAVIYSSLCEKRTRICICK